MGQRLPFRLGRAMRVSKQVLCCVPDVVVTSGLNDIPQPQQAPTHIFCTLLSRNGKGGHLALASRRPTSFDRTPVTTSFSAPSIMKHWFTRTGTARPKTLCAIAWASQTRKCTTLPAARRKHCLALGLKMRRILSQHRIDWNGVVQHDYFTFQSERVSERACS